MNLSTYLKDPPPERHFCLPIFNRATYGRCKTLISEISKYPHLKLTVILSSATLWEEFGKAETYIQGAHKNVEFKLIQIEKHVEGNHLGMALAGAEILSRFATFYRSRSFDAILVSADRYETLPAGLAAAYLGIPLVHLQGGEVTGNIDDKIRHSVTKLADYHFVSTKLSKEYIVQMGEAKYRVFLTGCPSLDLINKNAIRRFIAKEKYILCIFHPETENTIEAYHQTEVVLRAVQEYCLKYGHKCYWYYPNPDPGREEIIKFLDEFLLENQTIFIKAINKEPEQFLWQLAGARMIVGNSSCGIRESSFIGVPSVNIGERQGWRERGRNVLDASYEHSNILSALEFQHERKSYGRDYLYGVGRASEYIVKYLLKTDFSLKKTLTYPTSIKYSELHFGENRFHEHKKRGPFFNASKKTRASSASSSSTGGSESEDPGPECRAV